MTDITYDEYCCGVRVGHNFHWLGVDGNYTGDGYGTLQSRSFYADANNMHHFRCKYCGFNYSVQESNLTEKETSLILHPDRFLQPGCV